MSGDGALVLERLRALPDARELLDALSSHPGLWVVGGAVRDALLGLEPGELDLVVEGSAEEVARSLEGPVVIHEDFGTATVRGVDIASARREWYPRPGALPLVATGVSLREDLARRDFTVNSMAVRLVDGRLLEWPAAREDLRAGVLRVLHPGSFVDDPTRLLRLARYAARLGFAAEPVTGELAARAVGGGALSTVTGSRLGAELRRLLDERRPTALERLAQFGIGTALLGEGFEPGPVGTAVELLDSAVVALAAALGGTAPDDIRERLDWLAFPAGEREAVVAALRTAPAAAELLRREDWAGLRRLPVEAVAVAGARAGGPQRAAARRWLDELRHLRLEITGDDLVAAGLSGPAVGAALEAAWRAMLEGRAAGRAAGREEQLAAALGR